MRDAIYRWDDDDDVDGTLMKSILMKYEYCQRLQLHNSSSSDWDGSSPLLDIGDAIYTVHASQTEICTLLELQHFSWCFFPQWCKILKVFSLLQKLKVKSCLWFFNLSLWNTWLYWLFLSVNVTINLIFF